MKELCKLEEPFRQLLLTPGSMLFSDETTEQVRVYNQQKGKYEYRKQYIWGIKNPDRKIAYYLYDNGSRSMKVAQSSSQASGEVSPPTATMSIKCLNGKIPQ